MRNEIEKRLHRVMIKLEEKGIVCPYAIECLRADNSDRCNRFYEKCVKFTDFISDSNY
jgi:hypothetical protein